MVIKERDISPCPFHFIGHFIFIGWKMENDSKILTASWYDMYFSFDQGYYILSFLG